MNMGKSTNHEFILRTMDMNTLEDRRTEQSPMIELIYLNPELHHITLGVVG